jgi:BCD family chlorophyll transporter-like MFS transporter
MKLRRPVQIGLIHVAVALTLLPINSTLNRVMIKELAISATLVSILVSIPYLLSPMQVAIGSYADRNPVFNRRRTPYIALGLAMCVAGTLLAPHAGLALAQDGGAGFWLALLAFGLWGIGFNVSSVSYFSLASEVSDERGRSLTITVMFTMMVVSMIVMGIVVSEVVADYTPQKLHAAFRLTAGVATVSGILGLIGLEDRADKPTAAQEERHTWGTMFQTISGNPQARLFFVYLILLLAAILGQDVLLEPFAAEAFGMTVRETTRIVSIWGGFFLLMMLVAGPVQRRLSKRRVALIASWLAIAAFLLIVVSGLLASALIFYLGIVLLGGATGLSTVSNLSLMLGMTTPENVGLFIGAWGAASAFARLAGTVTGGVIRDVVTQMAKDDFVIGYMVVFALEALFLLLSVSILRRVDVKTFQERARQGTTFAERAALVGEVGSD